MALSTFASVEELENNNIGHFSKDVMSLQSQSYLAGITIWGKEFGATLGAVFTLQILLSTTEASKEKEMVIF